MIKKTTLLAVLGIALLSLPLQAQDINKKQSAPKVSSMSRPRTAQQTTLKPSSPQHSTPGTNSKATKVPSSGKTFRFALQPSQPRKTADRSARFTQPAKSYRSSLLLTAGEQVDEHGIIVQPGEGVRKVYTRSGRCIRDVNHEVMSDIDQSGTIQIVESEDGTVYTFHLRDAKWANGADVTAYDFEFAWKRIAQEAGEYAYLLDSSVGCVKNADAIIYEGADPETLGVEAVDAKTFVVTLERGVLQQP